MGKFVNLAMLICVLPLAACTQTGLASNCDAIRKLTPSSETRTFITTKDRPFAEQVASNNELGVSLKCW